MRERGRKRRLDRKEGDVEEEAAAVAAAAATLWRLQRTFLSLDSAAVPPPHV